VPSRRARRRSGSGVLLGSAGRFGLPPCLGHPWRPGRRPYSGPPRLPRLQNQTRLRHRCPGAVRGHPYAAALPLRHRWDRDWLGGRFPPIGRALQSARGIRHRCHEKGHRSRPFGEPASNLRFWVARALSPLQARLTPQTVRMRSGTRPAPQPPGWPRPLRHRSVWLDPHRVRWPAVAASDPGTNPLVHARPAPAGRSSSPTSGDSLLEGAPTRAGRTRQAACVARVTAAARQPGVLKSVTSTVSRPSPGEVLGPRGTLSRSRITTRTEQTANAETTRTSCGNRCVVILALSVVSARGCLGGVQPAFAGALKVTGLTGCLMRYSKICRTTGAASEAP